MTRRRVPRQPTAPLTYLGVDYGAVGSVVYFMQDGPRGPIKIGTTSNPARRRTALQTGGRKTMRIRRMVPGGYRIEAYYHKVFAHLRIDGEWFRNEGDLAGYLDPDFDLE